MNAITIKGGCTPSVNITIDFDNNPNGLPVLWICIDSGNKRIANAPLNKEAVGRLLVELANKIGEM